MMSSTSLTWLASSGIRRSPGRGWLFIYKPNPPLRDLEAGRRSGDTTRTTTEEGCRSHIVDGNHSVKTVNAALFACRLITAIQFV